MVDFTSALVNDPHLVKLLERKNVLSAFSYADLEKEVYMGQSLKLDKSLYRLKQALRDWNKVLQNEATCHCDSSIYRCNIVAILCY